MVSSTNPAFDLTVQNTASGPYALKVLTVIVAVLLPVVLLYQAWSYYVFRRRVSPAHCQSPPGPPARPAAPAGPAAGS